MKNNSRLITAFAVGAAAGAVLGILFAPDKGSALREKIKEKGEKLADEVKDKLRKASEAFECDREKDAKREDFA
jgi:gas vesicle protein